MNPAPAVHFGVDEWISDEQNPGIHAQYAGRSRKSGPHILVLLKFPDGSMSWRPLGALKSLSAIATTDSIESQLVNGPYGRSSDLRRLITFEKLKGTLQEVVYSMEAAQVDFYPYQFKPVLKFIRSNTERLLLADEVGLGKTIEAALIWIELQARRDARRRLVGGSLFPFVTLL
jgi:hypothetical protein